MTQHAPRVALVTHDLAMGGGTATVVAFLHRVLLDSGRYTPEIVSLATSMRDDLSVRLLSPATWARGVQKQKRQWRGFDYTHFGAQWTEFEFQRYRPRPLLSKYLDGFDLIQIVDGTPAWGGVALRCRPPVALFTATTIKAEREARLQQEKGLAKKWVSAMTELNERAERRVLGRVRCVFAESQSTLERVRPWVRPQRLLLGPPGVDTQFFRPAQGNAQSPTQGYILAVGRFSDPRKNVRLLLEAYAQLLRRQHGATPDLVLVGESPSEADRRLLETLGIASRVRVQVNVSQEELARLYQSAGLFVLSSDEEGLGIVILEAMASGLPVVSTDCGGPSTAVREGETGFLTPVGDARALCEAMGRALDDPERSLKMGRAGRCLAEEKFSLEATGRVYLERYDALLSPKSRR